MERRGFAAYPRRIAATKAKVLFVPAILRIVGSIPPVIGLAIGSVMMVGLPGLRRQAVTTPRSEHAAVLSERRGSDGTGKNKSRT